MLPPGIDESLLGVWHFNSSINDWEFGGTVNTLENTVTYVTDSFSPFQLGLVSEPSSFLLAACGAIALVAWRRKRNA